MRLPIGYEPASTPPPADAVPKLEVIGTHDIYPGQTPPGPYTNFHGIFIGISEYRNVGKLSNAERDARDFAARLTQISTLADPIVLTNEDATVENLRRRLRELAPRTTPNDLVLIHFSGHGIGLADRASGEQAGYLMFHNAETPARITESGNLTDLLNMQALDDLMTESGVRFKHRLQTLDCCFSGFGACLPVPTRGSTNAGIAAANWLCQPADLILTAGHAGQEVLDNSIQRQGYGLATGVLIDAITRPEEYGVGLIDLDGTRYLEVDDLFEAMQKHVPAAALEKLESLYLQQTVGDGLPSFSEFRREPEAVLKRLPPPRARRLAQIAELCRQLQTPQAINRGTGLPLIPLRAGVAAAVAAPEASAVPTSVPPTPMAPRPAKLPCADLPSAARPNWAIWQDLVARNWGSEAYGESASRFLRILWTEAPPPGAATAPMRVSLAVQVRPPYRADAVGRWQPIRRVGGIVPTGHLVRYILRNDSDRELYYYILAIDQTGAIQWIAPGLETNPWYEGGYATGPRTIAARSTLTLPPTSDGGSYPGQPTSGVTPQAFCFVVTAEPWVALEEAAAETGKLCLSLLDPERSARRPMPCAPFSVMQRAAPPAVLKVTPGDASRQTVLSAHSSMIMESWHMELIAPPNSESNP